jgi:hypothetical protein
MMRLSYHNLSIFIFVFGGLFLAYIRGKGDVVKTLTQVRQRKISQLPNIRLNSFCAYVDCIHVVYSMVDLISKNF